MPLSAGTLTGATSRTHGGNIGAGMLIRCHLLKNSCVFIVAFSLLGAVVPASAEEPTASDAQTVYEEALGRGLYGEAELAAKQLLDRAIREGRRDELSTAALLNRLALAQRLNSDLEAAQQNYELAVTVIESSKDMLDSALIEPLLGLGKTHIDNERPDLALEYLDRALHVRHVNDGPHSLEQTETLETLATAYALTGELSEAAGVADRLYLLYSREFPGKSMEVVPILLKQGHILGQIGDHREQRSAYNEAVDIAEHNGGKSSVSLIEPFISLGNSYVSEYFDLYLVALTEQELPDIRLLNKAKSFYESALQLARSNTDASWQLHSEALLALGDFYTLTEEQSRARVLYREAWRLLSADEARLARRRATLEIAVPLQQAAPDLTVALPHNVDDDSLGSSYGTGDIVTRFTVSRRGRLADIVLLEISPERNAAIEAEVKRTLTSFVYRPRFENGFAVDTPDQTIRYMFPYPKPEVEAP